MSKISINKILLTGLLCLLSIFPLFSEMSFESILYDYYRTMVLIGEEENTVLNYHTYTGYSGSAEYSSGPWEGLAIKDSLLQTGFLSLNLISPQSWTSYNTSDAWGFNDGALWQGRGFNTVFSGGLELEVPFLTVKLYPEVWAAQNLDIDIIETTSSSGYGDYWTVFDNLQRYGDSAYYDFNWGDTEIRLDWNRLTFSFSNQAVILGPGRMNNILLSDNAGGFPHFDLGTSEKIETKYFGAVEYRLLWGFLEESEFFDEDSTNDNAWIAGSYFCWEPPFWNNFSIGFNHHYYKPLTEWDSWDLIRGIPFVDRSNAPGDTKDMMMSIPFRWLFPSKGFEFYGEWARNDNFTNFESLYKIPEHTQAFTLGFNQILKTWEQNIIQLSIEFSMMARESTFLISPAGPWYRHAWAGWTQGYTNNGQILGAAIGPGSDSQWAKLSWIRPNGKTSIYTQRICYDKDYFYIISSQDGVDCFAEYNVGVEHLMYIGNIDLYGAFTSIYQYNYNYSNEYNYGVHFELGVKYNF